MFRLLSPAIRYGLGMPFLSTRRLSTVPGALIGCAALANETHLAHLSTRKGLKTDQSGYSKVWSAQHYHVPILHRAIPST